MHIRADRKTPEETEERKVKFIAFLHERMKEDNTFRLLMYASKTCYVFRKFQFACYDLCREDPVFKEKFKTVMGKSPCGDAWELWSMVDRAFPSLFKDLDIAEGVPVGVIDEWVSEANETYKN